MTKHRKYEIKILEFKIESYRLLSLIIKKHIKFDFDGYPIYLETALINNETKYENTFSIFNLN